MGEDSPKLKTAFITGASSGLGHGLCLWFARRGVRVFAAARRGDRLASLRDEAPHGLVQPVELDVTHPERTIAAIQEIDDECGLDLVIANAGISRRVHARDLGWAEVEQTLSTNVTGAAATLVAMAPRMARRGHGSLAGISSLAAFRGLPRHAAYSGAKAFLMGFLESLRIDLKPLGVSVTCAHPGFFKSELTAKNLFPMPFLLQTDEAVDRVARAIVRGRASVQFPWQLAWPARAGRLMPGRLYEAVIRRGDVGAVSGSGYGVPEEKGPPFRGTPRKGGPP